MKAVSVEMSDVFKLGGSLSAEKVIAAVEAGTIPGTILGQQVILYECGICDCLHPWTWDGDCREDSNRYTDPLDYAERHADVRECDIEVRSWEDRQAADTAAHMGIHL